MHISHYRMYHLGGGGTGSGLGSLLLQEISASFPKKTKVAFSLTPIGPTAAVTAPYNHVLMTPALCEHANLVFTLDNAGITAVCNRHLQIGRPTYGDMNRIIAQAISSVTMCERLHPCKVQHHCGICAGINTLPAPRLHFLAMSYSPILGTPHSRHSRLVATHCLQHYTGRHHSSITPLTPYLKNMAYMRHRILSYIPLPPTPPTSVAEITHAAFHPGHMLGSYDVTRGKFFFFRLVYRGDIEWRDVNVVVNNLKNADKAKRTIQFVDCVPSLSKVGMR